MTLPDVETTRELGLTKLQILASPPKALYVVPTVGAIAPTKALARSLDRTDLAFCVANYVGRCHRAIAKRQQQVVLGHNVSLDGMTRTDRQAFHRAITRLTLLGLISTP